MLKKITHILLALILASALLQSFGYFRPLGSEISYGWLFFKGCFITIFILAPIWLEHKVRTRIYDDLAYLLLITALVFEYLGTSYGWYRNLFWYDLIAHTMAGVLGVYYIHIFLALYLRLKKIELPSNFHFFIVLMTSCGVAVLNEMLEFFVDKVILDPYQRIYPGYDTVEDISLQTLGSLVGILLIMLFNNKSQNTTTPDN